MRRVHAPVHLPATRVWMKSICSNAHRQLRPVFQGKDDLTTVCCSRKRLYQRPRSQSPSFHLIKFRLFEGVFFSLCNGATIGFRQLHLMWQLVLTMASVVAVKKALGAPLVRLDKWCCIDFRLQESKTMKVTSITCYGPQNHCNHACQVP